jgi:hypothetical protein
MLKGLLIFCLAAFILPSLSYAGARRFTYVYESTTAPPGAYEVESWVTWKTERDDDRRFRQFDFRHEVEFGVTDRLQMAIYVADWSYLRGDSFERDGSIYTGSAVELMYNLTNAETSPLGSALYGELKVGDELVSLESKIILQKNLGPLVLAYNATLEAAWEGEDLEEKLGELQQTLGASYEIKPQFLVGGEVLHEIAFPEWQGAEDSVVFVGPNISVRAGKWWATATGLAQLTGSHSEPNFQLRTIVGYSF